MSKTPSEAAAEAVTDEYYRLLGCGEREIQDAQHEGRYFELQLGFQRLIDEAFGADEVVKALEAAEKASWHSEAFVKRDWRNLVSRVLKRLKGTDDED